MQKVWWQCVETSFIKLAELCNALEKTSKINEKILLVSTFLSALNENEIEPAVFLIIGTTFAEIDPQTLDISWKSILDMTPAKKQKTLIHQKLTIRSVHTYFTKLANISGAGSKKKKERILQVLFRDASSLERKFIARNIMGEMRHGVAEGVMIKAIARASHLDFAQIKRLNAIHGNLGEIAKVAIIKGIAGLQEIKVTLFTPIKPMLAESIDSIEDIFSISAPNISLEYKYDGIRAQIHKRDNEVRIFTRHLKEITSSFPEIVDLVLKTIPDHSVILDGEIIAVGKDNRPLTFQNLMRRFRRVRGVQRIQQAIATRLYLFDILYLDKEILFDVPSKERWARLAKTCNKLTLATRLVSSDLTQIRKFYQSALDAGHEGIMVKDLKGTYTPSERKKSWLKLKEALHVDLTIVAADWGSGRRTGWLSNYHLAALDPETGTFHVIGKTFKGLTDEEFKKMTKSLQQIKTRESSYTVFVKPQIVVEVAFNEIQKSPQYASGYALRFARIKRIRFDKAPYEAATLEEISRLYDRQFDKKGRA